MAGENIDYIEGSSDPHVDDAEEKDFREFVGVEHDAPSDPSWDNKRFRRVYRKAKDSERRATERDNDFKSLAEHNRKLAESVEKLSESAGKIVDSTAESRRSSAETELETMQTRFQSLQIDRKKAREDARWDDVDYLDDAIDDMKEKIAAKRTEVAKKAETKTETKTQSAVNELPGQTDVNAFVSSTPWYNNQSDDFDPVMAASAREYDAALILRAEYKGKPELTAARLKRVKEYIEDRFDYTPKKKGRGGDVEGVGNESRGARGAATTLTADEKRIAHRMFDDLTDDKAEEKYLKQKQLLGV